MVPRSLGSVLGHTLKPVSPSCSVSSSSFASGAGGRARSLSGSLGEGGRRLSSSVPPSSSLGGGAHELAAASRPPKWNNPGRSNTKTKKRAEKDDRELTDSASHVPSAASLTDLEHWALDSDPSNPKMSPPTITPKISSKSPPKASSKRGGKQLFGASISPPPRPPLLRPSPLPPLNSLPKRLPPPKITTPAPPPPKKLELKRRLPRKEFNIFDLLEPSDFDLLLVPPPAPPSPPPSPSPPLPPPSPSRPSVDSRPPHFSRRPKQEEKEPARSTDAEDETRPRTRSIPTSEPDPERTGPLTPQLQPSPPRQSFAKVASSSFLLKKRRENKDHDIVPLIPTFLSAPPSSPSPTTSSKFPRPSSVPPPSNTLESEILAQIQSRFEHLKPEKPHVVHRPPPLPSRPSHPHSSHRSNLPPPRTKVIWPEDLPPRPPPSADVAKPLVGEEITSTYLLGQQETRFFHEVRRRTGPQPSTYPSFEGGMLASSSSSPSTTPRDAAWSEVLSPLDSTADAEAEASNSAYFEDQRRLGLLASHPDLEIASGPWKIVVSSPTTYGIPNKTSFPTAWLEDCDPTLLDSTTGRKRLDLDPPLNGIAVITPHASEVVEDDFLRIELGSGSATKTVNIPLSFLAKQASEARRIEEVKKAAEEEASKSKSKPNPFVVASKSNSIVVPSSSSTRIATFHFDSLALSRKQVLKELESTGMITVRKGLKSREGETRQDAMRRLVDVLGGVWRDEKLPSMDGGSSKLLEMDLLHLPSPPRYQLFTSPHRTTSLSFIDTFSSALTLYHLQPHTFSSLVETSISHRSPPSTPSSSPTTPTPSGPPLPIITLSPSSTRLLKLWDSIARSSPTGTSSSRRPLPEIIAVNYSPSWRGTLPLGKEVGVAVAGMRLMQGLMKREGEKREWGAEEGAEEEDVRIVRRDRWVVERVEERGESWFMDMDRREGGKEGERK